MNGRAIPSLRRVQHALLSWHRTQGMQAPWRESGDPYEVLVAAVMAQQTQMSRVLPSYARFIAAFPNVESLAASSAGEVIRVWAGMGYNQRAIRLHRAARTIVAGGWPRDAESLVRIEGIGPFTAAIIASFAFGRPAACVDTNVRRVLGRLSGDEGIDGRNLQALADASIASGEPARWNQALMDYGARVCTIRPKCSECVVARWCASRRDAFPVAMVADERVPYAAVARPRRPAPKFEGSPRWWRGRIIDALRTLPAGDSVRISELPRILALDAAPPPEKEELRDLIAALERHGLVAVKHGRMALPD